MVLIRHHHRACGHPPLVVGNPRRRSRLGVEAAPLPHGSPCTRPGDVTYWILRHIHAFMWCPPLVLLLCLRRLSSTRLTPMPRPQRPCPVAPDAVRGRCERPVFTGPWDW